MVWIFCLSSLKLWNFQNARSNCWVLVVGHRSGYISKLNGNYYLFALELAPSLIVKLNIKVPEVACAYKIYESITDIAIVLRFGKKVPWSRTVSTGSHKCSQSRNQSLQKGLLSYIYLGCFWSWKSFLDRSRSCQLERQTHYNHNWLRLALFGKICFRFYTPSSGNSWVAGNPLYWHNFFKLINWLKKHSKFIRFHYSVTSGYFHIPAVQAPSTHTLHPLTQSCSIHCSMPSE